MSYLKSLTQYASRGEQGPSMYRPTRVHYAIDIASDGKLLGFVKLSGDAKGPEGMMLPAPTAVRAAGIKPLLLCDNAEYVLGIARIEEDSLKQPKRDERVSEQHVQFVALARACAEQTNEASVRSVVRFLESWNPAERTGAPADLDPRATLTFRVNGQFPIASSEVRRFWPSYLQRGVEGPVLECLVCGERKPVEQVLQKKIKGIPGGQTAGTSIISANAEAFLSYGLKQSLTSPTCSTCAEAFTDGLNQLLGDRRTSLRLGTSIAYVFWTREQEAAFDITSLFTEPRPDDVRTLLKSAVNGRESADVRDSDFHALALAANGGRAVVRDHIETTVPRARANLARWFRLQRLADGSVEGVPPQSVYQLCRSLTHDVSKELDPKAPQALVRAALTGGRIPRHLLHLAVRRNRAERGVTTPRAVLMKLVLVTNPDFGFKEDDLIELETENHEPAYLCGRLMAELENAQRTALGTTSATLVDRYFGSASTAPASVFGVLLRGAQAHLAKLRKTNEGAYHGTQQRLEEILAGLPSRGFPATLDLKSQAIFSLGYYHQKASSRAARAAAAERRKNPGENSE